MRALQDDQIVTCLSPELIDSGSHEFGLWVTAGDEPAESICLASQDLLSSRGTLWPERFIQSGGFLWLCQRSVLVLRP